MRKLSLSLAVSDYDHVRDLTSGKISVDGVDLLPLDLEIEEIFHRLLTYNEFDIGEISMGMYTSLISRGVDDYFAIPVFPMRSFRHSIVYVRAGGSIAQPADLRGKRVGIPQWSQTAVTYVRSFLMHDYGIPLESIDWYQGGVNQPGRLEPVKLALPAGVHVTGVPDRTMNDMLVAGDLDAIISARTPLAVLAEDPRVRRLFPDFQNEEKAYFKRTGIFPIMHTVVVRKNLLETNPWLARSLYDAFELARKAGAERVRDMTSSRMALPWTPAYAADAAKVLGDDPFAYGIEANRTTLESFFRFCHEQGVAHKLVTFEDMFAEQLNTEYRV